MRPTQHDHRHPAGQRPFPALRTFRHAWGLTSTDEGTLEKAVTDDVRRNLESVIAGTDSAVRVGVTRRAW